MDSNKIKFPFALVMFLIAVVLFFVFLPPRNTPYFPVDNSQHKQDSLQHRIDSLSNNNILFDSINELNNGILLRNIKIDKLQIRLKNEQEKTKQLVNSVDGWTDNDIIQFFSNRYDRFIPDSVK